MRWLVLAVIFAGSFATRTAYAEHFDFDLTIETTNGKTISKHNLRKMLLRAIEKEDKQKPLSDEEIAGHLSQLGVCCARRTVAKYRTAMKIAPAAKRRKWAL